MTHALPAPEPKPPYRPPEFGTAPMATGWLVGHNRSFDDVLRLLRDGAEAAAFRAYFGVESYDFEWHNDERLDPAVARRIDISLEFLVTRHLILVNHHLSWMSLLTDPAAQAGVRAACRSLCDALGSPRGAVFFPCERWEDYWICQYPTEDIDGLARPGRTFADVVAELPTRFGPPAASLGAILHRDDEGRLNADGHFIDPLGA
jgi:hypothetical protein